MQCQTHCPEFGTITSLACSDPPVVNLDDRNVHLDCCDALYVEQFMSSFDRATRESELRGGDIGWNNGVPRKTDMGFYRPKPKMSLLWLFGLVTLSALNLAMAKVGLGMLAAVLTLFLLLCLDFSSEKIRFTLAMTCVTVHALLST